MIPKLLSSVSRLTIANRLLAVCLLVVCLGGAGAMFHLGKKLADISDRIHPGAEEEQRRLRANLVIDAQVDEVLGGLSDDLDADRTLVFLAHNGMTDLTGKIPFMFLSNTQVHLRPGLSWEERWSRPVPLSAVSGTLRRMFLAPEKPVCIKVDRTDLDLSAMARARLDDRGVELTFLCPLNGPNGVVGIVSAEYLRRETARMPAKEIMERVGTTTAYIHRAMTGM